MSAKRVLIIWVNLVAGAGLLAGQHAFMGL